MALQNIVLILVSSLFHAGWNILTQTSRNSQFLSGLKGLWIMAGGLVFVMFNGVGHLTPEMWKWIAISGVLHGVYILSLSQAYNTADISYVYPIARSAPALVPLFAWWWLGERLAWTSLLAIFMILLAVYMLHFKGKILEGFRNVWDAILHKDLRWAFITLGLVVAYSLVDKKGMDILILHFQDRPLLNGLEFFFLESFLGFSICNTWLFLKHPHHEIVNAWGQEKMAGFVAGVFTLGSYGLICVVLQLEAVSEVVAIRQTSVLMVTLWGILKLREPFGIQRVAASFLIVAGVGLMGLKD